MLDLELGNHSELSSLLDLEWLVLQGGLCTLCGEVDGHRGAASSFQREGEDDALARVVWIGDGWSGGEAKGSLVALKGLIAGIYGVSVESMRCTHVMCAPCAAEAIPLRWI